MFNSLPGKKFLATTLGGAGAVVALTATLFAPSAQAAEWTAEIPVDMTSVCKDQNFAGAYPVEPLNPYGWQCYDAGFPGGVNLKGSLDIQGWCNARFPGSVATVDGPYAFDSWFCNLKYDPFNPPAYLPQWARDAF
ncbi:hypothetical protein MT355_20155 [Rathayibacter sp. VKM Ac-2929]|uniref:hypothetical protein n=1 Tax=Rathayibacter sp. VKM Ac-2929 TaxID=2929480 RepID=UPI001FB1FB30|nr:hypothetical protein [Rathayibacter sp. VKM Ac-2929]MCJ1675585.1 hypothetical protein [Rathayibacter sp. VKM Ac-2929]